MAMGKRKQRQESLFITADNLPRSDGHPFYQKLNALLAEADFDRWIEGRCRQYYEQDEQRGKPSAFRRACTFACCWSATSRGSTASAASPGVVPTA